MGTTVGRRPMIRAVISRTWWIVLVRGIAGIVLGGALFSQTRLDVETLAEFMGIYWLADGAFMLIWSLAVRRAGKWWRWMLVRGILGILAGLVALGGPEASTVLRGMVLIWILAGQAIVAGIIDLITNYHLRQELGDEWAMTLSALLQIVFGVLLAISPAATVRLIGIIVGAVAFLGGIGMIPLSIRMRKLTEKDEA